MTQPHEQTADMLAMLAAAIAHDPAPRHTQPAWELALTIAARGSPEVTYRPLSCTGRLAVPGVSHLLPRPVILTGIVHHHRTPFLVQLRHTDHCVVVPAGWVTSPDTDLTGAEPPGPARTPPAGPAALTPARRDQLAALVTDEVAGQLHRHGTDVQALQHPLHAAVSDTPRPGHRLSLPCAAVLTGIAAEDLALLVGHGILGAVPHPLGGGVDVDLLDLLALASTAGPAAHPDAPIAGSGLAVPNTEAAVTRATEVQLTEMCTPPAWLAGHGREYVRACLENLPGAHAWGPQPAVRHAAKAAAIDGLLILEHDPPAARHVLYRAVARHRDFLADEVRYQQHRGPARAVDLGLDELGGALVASHIDVAGHWLAAEVPAGHGRSCVIPRRLGDGCAGTALAEIREVINRLDIAVYDVA